MHYVSFTITIYNTPYSQNICKFNFSIMLDILQIAVIPNCSILAAVGQKMASTPGVSATLFSALAKVKNFHILWSST